jgi:hypothetical protein
VSLASSVAMNILLSSKRLNIFVVTTFGVAFVASLLNGEKVSRFTCSHTLQILSHNYRKMSHNPYCSSRG